MLRQFLSKKNVRWSVVQRTMFIYIVLPAFYAIFDVTIGFFCSFSMYIPIYVICNVYGTTSAATMAEQIFPMQKLLAIKQNYPFK